MPTTNKKTSIIWTITIENLQKLLDESNSISSILPKLGLSKTSAGSYKALYDRIKRDKLDLILFNENKKNNPCHKNVVEHSKLKKIPLSQILVENSTYCRHNLKKRLIEEHLKDYKCVKCGNIGEWAGEKLSLQLEHINGINNDNRLENLCFLCPNCHSQSSTFCGKNKLTAKKTLCKLCGSPVTKHSKFCQKCFLQTRIVPMKFEISKEELENLVKIKSIIEIGRMFNVTDNTIRKRCIKLGIEIPKYSKGYWLVNESFRNITKEDLERLLKDFSIKDISKNYSVSIEYIKKLCYKFNILQKKQPISPITLEEETKIKELYNQGYSQREIEKIVNIKRDRFRKFFISPNTLQYKGGHKK